MQIYIHVPFCRQRCHYCGFYSTVLEKNEPILAINAKNQELPIFNPPKTPLTSTGKPQNLATPTSEPALKQKPKPKDQAVSLASFLKSSEPKNNVQSLADVLKNKAKQEKDKPFISNGLTLADAFLSPERAKSLRQDLGLTQPIIPELKNSELKNLEVKNPPKASKHEVMEKVKNLSNFLGKELDYSDLDATNEHTRYIFKSKQNQTLEKANRLALPLLLPPDFVQSQEAKSKIYQVWLKALLAEIKIYAKLYSDVPISSIYFGGGTPSIIDIKDLETIMRSLIKNFHINQNAEISLEVNPESLTKEKAIAYNKIGFNRISLGVQSLDDAKLKYLGRVHNYSDVLTAFKQLRQANFNNISIDLIWGLPGQSYKDWHKDLTYCVDLDPEHISCYGLSFEEGSLFYKLHSDGNIELPDEKTLAKMYKNTFEVLKTAGYLQYEISNYAKVGYQCRHNLGYWHNIDYLGFGPSATGTIGKIRRTQAKSIIDWAKDIQSGSLKQDLEQSYYSHQAPEQNNSPYNFSKEILTEKEISFEFIMLRLRTSKGLNLEEYTALTKKSLLQEHGKLIKKLIQLGLMKMQNGYLSITANGMLISDSILEKFIK